MGQGTRGARAGRIGFLAAAVISSLLIGGAASASGEPAPDNREALAKVASNHTLPLQERIDAQMRVTPGGTQVSANEIAWEDGKFGTVIMSFPNQGKKKEPPMSAAAARFADSRAAKDPARATSASQSAAVTTSGIPITPGSYNHGCPAYWYCFYEHAYFNQDTPGRRLQWSDPHCGTTGRIDFADWGFRNQTSSWVNTDILIITVKEQTSGPDPVLWVEEPRMLDPWIGSANNDRADYFEACRY